MAQDVVSPTLESPGLIQVEQGVIPAAPVVSQSRSAHTHTCRWTRSSSPPDVVFTPAVIRSYPTTMEEITPSPSASCSGVQQAGISLHRRWWRGCLLWPPPTHTSLDRPQHWITHPREGVGMCAPVCVFGRKRKGETETWWELGPLFPPGVVVRFSPHQCGMGSASLTTHVPFIKKNKKIK